MKPTAGRRITQLFFNKVSDAMWQCRCGSKRKKSGTSYANLVSHVRSAHPEFEELLCADPSETQNRIHSFFSNSKATVLYGWFRLVIICLLPFSVVENEEVREHVKYKPIALSTFMSYLPRLTQVVETKISEALPDSLALIFDGWTAGSTHYLAIFASFPAENTFGYSTRLLTMSPMQDEEDLTASTHLDFIAYILSVYNKTMSDVVAFIGDNCATNKALATKARVPIIGCASHRFNLTVQLILSAEDDLIERVNNLMSKLKNLLLAAKLRRVADVAAKTRNKTHWSSTFEMLLRYAQIRGELGSLQSPEVDAMCFNAGENRLIDTLITQLKKVESVTKRLQGHATTMSDVRYMFDKITSDFTETTSKLSATAEIMNDKVFESAIVMAQRGDVHEMSLEERNAIKKLEKYTDPSTDVAMAGFSYADLAIQSSSAASEACTTNYVDLRFLTPTSNICERLFSKAGYALNDRLRGVSPANFEAQIFLHAHRDLWSAANFVQLFRNTDDS